MSRKKDAPPETKFNMTVIDRDSSVENFLYRGVSESDKADIVDSLGNKERVAIHFHYDEGEVFITKEYVHTLVFSMYISEADEEPQEDI